MPFQDANRWLSRHFAGISCAAGLILDSQRLLEIEEDSISLFFIERA
jgi:hypothetical protein